MAIHLTHSVAELPGIGGKAVKDLKGMGISSVRDLLLYVPFRYDDFSKKSLIDEVVSGETVTIVGEIESIHARVSGRNKRLTIVEAVIFDNSGSLKVIWFNQQYLVKNLKPGMKVSLAGRVDDKYGLSLVNPIYETEEGETHTGRIVPVYGLSGSITMRRLRSAIKAALVAASEFMDWVPKDIIQGEAFPTLAQAIASIHFPESKEKLFLSINRLKFDELFLHQMMFAQIRMDRLERSCFTIDLDDDALKQFVAQLPFTLTSAQRKAAWEIVQDMAGVTPMNRLLEGDVGSGKTAVAAIAASSVLRNNRTLIYLAPTEILAAQQHASFQSYLLEHRIGLLTRSQAMIGSEQVKKKDVIEAMRHNALRCVIGTHALLQESVEMKDLALVIVDEQHRFGVKQRHALLETNGKPAPHLLSMTATPIPRSLALTLYGDLELSILDELPTGRKAIGTAIVPETQRDGMWKHVCEQINAGHQVFVVCPLIDPSDKLGTRSVEEVKKELSNGPLRAYVLEKLHGKMKPDEKQRVIANFRDGKVDVLVSTTVVEVGVDVPNATVMVIIGAERFGLAQLHQLRGRVGRSDIQSYCYLLPGPVQGVALERLEALEKSTNGFELAEKDLELRGPGNIFGNAQSGFPDFQLATPADVELMKKARDWSTRLLDADGHLQDHPLIRDKLQETFDKVHLE